MQLEILQERAFKYKVYSTSKVEVSLVKKSLLFTSEKENSLSQQFATWTANNAESFEVSHGMNRFDRAKTIFFQRGLVEGRGYYVLYLIMLANLS